MKTSVSKTLFLFVIAAVFLLAFSQEVFAINPQPFLKGAGKLIKPLKNHLDELFTLAPVVATIFGKLSGVTITLTTAVYARTKKSKKSTFFVCLLLGITGGIWTSQAWFNCPLGVDVGIYSILITGLCAVVATLLWLLFALAPIENSTEHNNSEQGSVGN